MADSLFFPPFIFYRRKYLITFDKILDLEFYIEGLLDEHNCESCRSIRTLSHKFQIKVARHKMVYGIKYISRSHLYIYLYVFKIFL
jgi:hypothetical protein